MNKYAKAICVAIAAVTASGCGSPKISPNPPPPPPPGGFTIQTVQTAPGLPLPTPLPNVDIDGFWVSDPPGATNVQGSTTIWPRTSTGPSAQSFVTGGRVPATWLFRFDSGPCSPGAVYSAGQMVKGINTFTCNISILGGVPQLS